jgi:hypothetical protein
VERRRKRSTRKGENEERADDEDKEESFKL